MRWPTRREGHTVAMASFSSLSDSLQCVQFIESMHREVTFQFRKRDHLCQVHHLLYLEVLLSGPGQGRN